MKKIKQRVLTAKDLKDIDIFLEKLRKGKK